jgi:hypothetical protein
VDVDVDVNVGTWTIWNYGRHIRVSMLTTRIRSDLP